MSSEVVVIQETAPRKIWGRILKSGTNIFLVLYCLSLFSKYIFIAELISHFQVFHLGCALFGVTLAYFLKKRNYLIVHAITAIYILSLLIPFYFADKKSNNSEPVLSIYQSNVLISNHDSKILLGQISTYKPNVVLLIETGELWDQKTLELNKTYPYEFKSLVGTFGFILYSKLPIKSCEILQFETTYDCINALLDWNGKEVRFIGAHPPPPVREEVVEVRNKYLSGISGLVQNKKNLPTIICGDLNITPWSYAYKNLVNEAELISTRKGFGILGSWPSSLPYKIPIDHCLLTKQFGIINTQVLPNIHSDHLPMLHQIYLKSEK